MTRLIALLFCLATTIHAAGPVRIAFDPQVIDWNKRCLTNDLFSRPNYTISLLASSVWMGKVRALGLYPGNIIRANLMCGRSYGGTNGCGDSITNYNIGAPQVPLINGENGTVVGNAMDLPINVSPVNAYQSRWKYSESGSGGGLGCVGTNNVMANTGMIPLSVYATVNSNVHLSAYLMGTNSVGYFIGVDQNPDYMFIASGTGFAVSSFWSSTGYPVATNTALGEGFFLGTRISNASTGLTVFVNNTLGARSSSVGGAAINIDRPICLYGYNAGSSPLVPSSFTAQLCGGYSIGRGITDAAEVIYYGAWQQFETLLGRQK